MPDACQFNMSYVECNCCLLLSCMSSARHLAPCRALDVLPLRPGRSDGGRRLAKVASPKPQRHKPDAAKGSALKGHVEPIGPKNSKRAPAKRKAAAKDTEDAPAEGAFLGPADAEESIYAPARTIGIWVITLQGQKKSKCSMRLSHSNGWFSMVPVGGHREGPQKRRQAKTADESRKGAAGG